MCKLYKKPRQNTSGERFCGVHGFCDESFDLRSPRQRVRRAFPPARIAGVGGRGRNVSPREPRQADLYGRKRPPFWSSGQMVPAATAANGERLVFSSSGPGRPFLRHFAAISGPTGSGRRNLFLIGRHTVGESNPCPVAMRLSPPADGDRTGRGNLPVAGCGAGGRGRRRSPAATPGGNQCLATAAAAAAAAAGEACQPRPSGEQCPAQAFCQAAASDGLRFLVRG